MHHQKTRKQNQHIPGTTEAAWTPRERVGCLSEITTAVSLSGVLAETGREAGDAWSDCQG